MMKKLLCTSILLTLPAFARSAALDLENVLAQMDRAAAGFKSMQASVTRLKYTALIDEKETETGTMSVSKDKKGVRMLIAFKDPYPYYLAVNGNKAEIYRPRVAYVEEYDLTKSKDMFEQAFLLGFGTSGKYLRENYELKFLGEETVGGVETVKLELIPKSEKMLKHIPRLEMWISTATWQAVQQRVGQPGEGDYRLFTYSEMVLNPSLSKKTFKLKIPGGTKRVFPTR
jgi:outer membrane lipoprotein-sorting protein